ncbi:MAG: EpsG family protein, partial [Clostridiales bacterium]|nr:EpsG family protein [Clostridiales bacterium]
MAKYILILFLPPVAGFLAKLFNGKRPELILGKEETRTKVIWFIISAVPLIIFAANRGHIGDTSAYEAAFGYMPSELSDFSDYASTVTKDKLFYYTSALIKIFITENPIVYFGIIAAFQAFALLSVYRKYSEDFFLSYFLFLVSTDYISWMFNGIRQFVAVCLTFSCFGLVLRKKYILAILIIILATFFHGTAFLVIPFIFISQGKAWNKKTIAFIFGVIIVVAFIDQFTDILDDLLTDTQYESVVTDWTSWDDDGTNVLRVLVYAVPTLLSLYGKKHIDSNNDPVINFCTNMSIVTSGIYVISIFTSGIFIGRLPIYFSLYNYILLPWEINHIFSGNSAKIVKSAMIIFYMIYYFLIVIYQFD